MYTPLFVKTDYTLLGSLVKIDRLITYLKEYNISSCGICDDNLFGVMEIITKFEKAKIKPIIGLNVKLDGEDLLLYAKDNIGYHNLIKIEGLKNEGDLSISSLTTYKEGILAICYQNNYDKLKDIYNDLYLGVWDLNSEYLASSKGAKCVYVNKVLYIEKYEYKYLPYVFMIRDGKTISDGINFVYQDNFLYKNNEVVNLVSSDAISNSNRIKDLCNFKLEYELYMPSYGKDSKEYLVSLSKKGLSKRFNGDVKDIYKERLNYELGVILKMHFEDYFLVVYDYIRYAKKNDILVGPGRGSAAGSLVSYALGITEVDPIKYNLLFERFLNPERVSMPDIDTDFPDVDRDKVISYVREKYGNEKVAGIITFGTLLCKQACRDVGRVLNIPLNKIDLICKRLSMKDSLKMLRERDTSVDSLLSSDDKFKLFYNIVTLIMGNKRHTSTHAAGIVISRVDVSSVVPVILNDGMYLTEYTMEYLEMNGLIKMDFLGIRNLSVIKNIISDINKYTKDNISFNSIPLSDQNTISIFRNGDTTGIFQFESAGMKSFLKDLKANNFNDICNAIALFRPGPALSIPTFIKRREGSLKVVYPDKRLEDILKDTYGIIIYQEQIMSIAHVMASYTLGEADILRRAMSKKKLDILKSEEKKFIENAVANKYSLETSKEVYDLILKFANYGFNKSHSVSYSIIAFKMAYLKYYYPKYFYSNLLNSVIGSEIKTLEYFKEMKKKDIKVLPPCVNNSLADRYLVTDQGLLMPLSSIRNIGMQGALAITSLRDGGYKDIFDFLRKTYSKSVSKKTISSLIYAHAFDCFKINMRTLIENLDIIFNYASLSFSLETDSIMKPDLTFYDEYDSDDILENEKSVFGFYLTSHKTEKYKLNCKEAINVSAISSYLNKNIIIIVGVDRKKELNTKSGDKMAFIDASDNTGGVTLVCFPKFYDNMIKKGDIIKAFGKVEKRYDEYQFVVSKLEKIN